MSESDMEVSDEENVGVIEPAKDKGKTKVTAPLPESVEYDCDLDDIDEDDSINKEVQKSQSETNTTAPFCHVGDAQVDYSSGIRTSMGKRPEASHERSYGNSEAPSALQEEREARENFANNENDAWDTMTDDDNDLVRDEEHYKKIRPIMREQGKSKPCYRVPFSACVHMPFVNEMSVPIQPYSMTAERYTEMTVAKNSDTTKEIIQAMTPAKLAQQVAVFKVISSKAQASVNSLRRYAAFICVNVTDFEDAHTGLSETLADGQALYQLEPKVFTKLFTGEHGLKLPKSLVPTSKTVEYVKLVPKTEAEAKPEGWILCPSIGDAKNSRRAKDKGDKDRANKKQKPVASASVDGAEAAASEHAAPQVAAAPAAADTIPTSAYKEYAFVPGEATSSTLAVAPIPKAHNHSAAEWRSETYSFNLQARNEWPTIGPSFDFDSQYSSLEVSFKIFRKN